jgi:hypothetical protein
LGAGEGQITSGGRGRRTRVGVLDESGAAGVGVVVGAEVGGRVNDGVGLIPVGSAVSDGEMVGGSAVFNARPSPSAATVESDSTTISAVAEAVGGLVELAVGTAWVGKSARIVGTAVSCRPRFGCGGSDSAVGARVGSDSTGGKLAQADRVSISNTRKRGKDRQRAIEQHYNNPGSNVTNQYSGISKS